MAKSCSFSTRSNTVEEMIPAEGGQRMEDEGNGLAAGRGGTVRGPGALGHCGGVWGLSDHHRGSVGVHESDGLNELLLHHML